MTSAVQRWTVWLVLLVATLAATVWVDRNSSEEAELVEPAGRVPGTLSVTQAEPKPAARRPPDSPTTPVASVPPGSTATTRDPFAVRSWYVSSPPPPPEPPPKPTAPPLPFRYLGMLRSGEGQWLVQLERGNEAIVAAQGETIGDLYRLEGLKQGELVFTYLPLGTRQSLPAILDTDP